MVVTRRALLMLSAAVAAPVANTVMPGAGTGGTAAAAPAAQAQAQAQAPAPGTGAGAGAGDGNPRNNVHEVLAPSTGDAYVF
ncbi:hypothetical protein OHA98_03935 [Streptomyces sp. NBC_00654]|uniref:hypothetical protein n=1 Tax=Streptomyces sp. NBC_00654 TaxID=2975799 RepID=UPI0022525940|nr:hypothetical protein [Streptomyces sp. NBC_00654]MCX4963983.1 hypothetical protein [Streptomyces sp. NBC_00654]